MKRLFFATLTIWLITAMSLADVRAEDSALFDDLDAIMAKDDRAKPADDLVPGESGAGVLRQLYDHANLSATLRYSHFFQTANGDDDDVAELLAEFDTYTGQDLWRVHAAGWAEAGTQDHMYAGATQFFRDEDRRRRHFELNEIYAALEVGEMEVILGKRVIPRDTELIYQPSYVYHPLDLNVPVEPKTFGLWQIAADVAVGDTRFTGAVLPVFQDPKIPDIQSRWMPFDASLDGYWFQDEFYQDFTISDLESLILYYYWLIFRDDRVLRAFIDTKTVKFENDLPEGSLDELGYLAKVESSIGLWDVYGSYFYGPTEFPVLHFKDDATTVTISKQNPMVHKFGGGAATTWGNFTIHGDGVYSYCPDDADDSFIRYTAGFTYAAPRIASLLGMERVDLMADYAGEFITDHQDGDGYYFSSERIRPFKNDLILRLICTVTEDLTAMYITDQDMEDDSQYHRVGASYRLFPGLVPEVYAEWFDGEDASYLGQWRHNDRVVVLLNWTP